MLNPVVRRYSGIKSSDRKMALQIKLHGFGVRC